jgi:hypothetical protein
MPFAPCIQLASEGSDSVTQHKSCRVECRSAAYLGAEDGGQADGGQVGYYTRSHRNRAHTLIRLDHDAYVLKLFSI